MKIKTVKISDKGQIAIPNEIRKEAGMHKGDELILMHEDGRILIEKAAEISKDIKDDFKDLLTHSEKAAKKMWENRYDEIWNKV